VGSRGQVRLSLRRRFQGGFLAIIACCFIQSSASATGVQVTPISFDFTAQDQAQALWLTNTSKQPVNVQIRIFEWSQVGGEDQLTPTRDMVPSSAILSIVPGQRQLVRLMRLNWEGPARELSYRVFVDELPSTTRNGHGLRFLVRYSIPLFVLPPGAVPRFKAGGPPPSTDPASFSARVNEQGGKTWLVVHNSGGQRLRLRELALVNAQGRRQTIVPGLVGYVLAGQDRRWQIPVTMGALRENVLRAKLNDDPDEQSLSLDHASQ